MEPGLKTEIPLQNKKIAPFFSVKEMNFQDKDENVMKKHLYFCHDPVQFLAAVDRERGREGVEQVTLIQVVCQPYQGGGAGG